MSQKSGLEKKKRIPILSEKFPNEPRRYYSWGHPEVSKPLQEKANEIFIDKESPNKESFLPLDRVYIQRHGRVYSGYNSIFNHKYTYHSLPFPTHLGSTYAVLIIRRNRIAATFVRGSITTNKIYPQSIKSLTPSFRNRSSVSARTSLLDSCRSLLESWSSEVSAECCFYSCDQEYEDVVSSIAPSDKQKWLQRIPFPVKKASIDELTRIWSKLFCVVDHGTAWQFRKSLSSAKKIKEREPEMSKQATSFNTSTKAQRIAEKLHWPVLSSRKKNQIHEALKSNDEQQLQDLNISDYQIIDYLSVLHEKLGNQSFLHYATKENLTETVEFLLNVGCDSQVKDVHGNIPNHFAKSEEMKEVYEEFENGNSPEDKWEKWPNSQKIDSRHQRKRSTGKPRKPKKNRKTKKHKNSFINDFTLKVGSKFEAKSEPDQSNSQVETAKRQKCTVPLKPFQIRDIQTTVRKNSYGALRKLHLRLYPGVINYLYEPHEELAGQTYLRVAVRECLDNTLKFLLERYPPWRRTIKDLDGKNAIDYCTSEKIRAIFVGADGLQKAYYDKYPKKRNK